MLDQAQGNSLDIVIMDGSEASLFLRDTLTIGGTAILRGETADGPGLGFALSVASGLSMCPRQLESRYLYDRQGSAIFDRITEQPEYYLTRTEAGILADNACRIREITGPVTLVELGSGYSLKTDHLLRAWLACAPSVRYIPVDVSEAALCEACRIICNLHLSAHVIGVNGDYREAFPMLREVSPVMVVFLGSTIGNFEPEDESRFLAELASSLSPGDFFLLGVDLVKEQLIIESAYNDVAGVTADFTRNLFARMNRELGSDIDLSVVEHVARYNPLRDQVDIHARFARKQIVRVESLGKSFAIAEGEMILTEISRKYYLEACVPSLEGFGFETEAVFTDERNWFALILLKRTDSLSESRERRT